MPAHDKFRGFQGPNYTQVPDQLFDELLADLPGAELKVLLYIMRRTFGFKKDNDNIAISQMLGGIKTRDGRQIDRGVGLSKPTLLKALRALIDRGIVIAERRRSAARGDESTNYRLNVISATGTESPNGSRNGNAAQIPVVKEFDHGGANLLPRGVVKEISQGVVKKLAPQETVRQQTDFNNVNVDFQKPSNPENRRRAPTTISEAALRNRYGFTDRQIDESRRLVYLQIAVLGAGDRNHAAYVKRAAEAVRDGATNVLQQALAEVKEANDRKPIGSLPGYFTRVYDAMREATSRSQPDLSTDRRRFSTDEQPTDLQQMLRQRLLTSIAAKGYAIPVQIQNASTTDIATWFDQVERTGPTPQP